LDVLGGNATDTLPIFVGNVDGKLAGQAVLRGQTGSDQKKNGRETEHAQDCSAAMCGNEKFGVARDSSTRRRVRAASLGMTKQLITAMQW
jgi:hypothetical protein